MDDQTPALTRGDEVEGERDAWHALATVTRWQKMEMSIFLDDPRLYPFVFCSLKAIRLWSDDADARRQRVQKHWHSRQHRCPRWPRQYAVVLFDLQECCIGAVYDSVGR